MEPNTPTYIVVVVHKWSWMMTPGAGRLAKIWDLRIYSSLDLGFKTPVAMDGGLVP